MALWTGIPVVVVASSRHITRSLPSGGSEPKGEKRPIQKGKKMILLKAFAAWWAKSLLMRLAIIVVSPLFILLVVLPVELLAGLVGSKISAFLGLSHDGEMIAVFLAFMVTMGLLVYTADRIRLSLWNYRLTRYLKNRQTSN
jgi:hypothetical protein